MKQKVKYKGIMFIVLSALCFAFMNVFVRMAGDLPAVQKSFFLKSGGVYHCAGDDGAS